MEEELLLPYTSMLQTLEPKNDIRNYCNLTTCRRRFVIEYFGGNYEASGDMYGHECCDNCAVGCACDACLTGEDLFDDGAEDADLIV